MTDEDVLVPSLVCAECGRSSVEAQGWKAYFADGDDLDEELALVFFCPACAAREFGSDRAT